MISRRNGWRAETPATGGRATVPAAPTDDRGSVTAELAVALPVLVLLLIAALSSVNAVLLDLRCFDAAREAARAAARGEAGVAAGERVAPPGAVVSVQVRGDEVQAVVRMTVEPLGGRLPGFDIAATAIAAVEPTPAAWPDASPPIDPGPP